MDPTTPVLVRSTSRRRSSTRGSARTDRSSADLQRVQIVINTVASARASPMLAGRVEDEEVGTMSVDRTPEELADQVRFLEAEVVDLRRRLGDAPGHSRGLELRLADTQRSLSAVSAQNER